MPEFARLRADRERVLDQHVVAPAESLGERLVETPRSSASSSVVTPRGISK